MGTNRSLPVRAKQEKRHGNSGLLQQLLGGRLPNKYYLSSHNTETQNHSAQYGCPERLISDNGQQFTSLEFAKFA